MRTCAAAASTVFQIREGGDFLLTEKQRHIFEFIRSFTHRNGYPPTVREIASAVGLSSTSSVHLHLNTLERLGLITRADGKTRAISLGEPDGIPILGTVAAGEPLLAAEDALGFLPWRDGNPDEYFALRIRGESMKNAGILDGDMVVVKRQQTARSGEIVIALLDDSATCKRLSVRNGQVLLLPENDEFEPIDGTGLQILGRVTAVIRTY